MAIIDQSDNVAMFAFKNGNYLKYELRNNTLIVVAGKFPNVMEFNSPNHFLDMFLRGAYLNIETQKKYGKKIELVYETKLSVIHLISFFEMVAKEHGPKIELDFSRILIQVDGAIEAVRAELEGEKFDLERKKLKRDTAWYVTVILIATFFMTIITMLEKCPILHNK